MKTKEQLKTEDWKKYNKIIAPSVKAYWKKKKETKIFMVLAIILAIIIVFFGSYNTYNTIGILSLKIFRALAIMIVFCAIIFLEETGNYF